MRSDTTQKDCIASRRQEILSSAHTTARHRWCQLRYAGWKKKLMPSARAFSRTAHNHPPPCAHPDGPTLNFEDRRASWYIRALTLKLLLAEFEDRRTSCYIHALKLKLLLVHRVFRAFSRPPQGSVEAVGFCVTHPWVATGGTDGGLKVWDSVSGTCRHTCSHPAGVTRLEWHPAAPVSSAQER